MADFLAFKILLPRIFLGYPYRIKIEDVII